MKRHVLLVGLSGAGKTTVGPLAARHLGARFLDVDAAVTEAEGRSIASIFAEQGEAAFRRREHALVRAALDQAPQVIAPGGGWAAEPGRLQEIKARALTVWLQVAPGDAAARTAGGAGRPLVQGADAAARLAALLETRGPQYAHCEVTLDTSCRTVEQVAADVAELARSLAGW